MPSVSTNHLYNSIYNSNCVFVFLLWTIIVTICTYVLLCTYGLCYFAFTDCVVIIIVVALFDFESINASIIQGSAIGPTAYAVNAGDLKTNFGQLPP